MSIIIKGMKMPQKAGDYDARLHVNLDGTALFYLYKECGGHAAKEILPHGRLIDADALKVMMPSIGDEYLYARDMIEEAPTIIEAEGERE